MITPQVLRVPSGKRRYRFRKASGSGPGPELMGLLGRAYALAGDRTNALDLLRQLDQRVRSGDADPYFQAWIQAALGQKERSLKWAERALSMRPDDAMLLYNVACIYSLAGRGETALECLERAVGAGLTQREWLARDSNLDPIRGTARFEALMARLA